MTSITDAKQIIFNRDTKDFSAFFDGELIGAFDTRPEAQAALDDHALRLIEDGPIDLPLTTLHAQPCISCGDIQTRATCDACVEWQDDPDPEPVPPPWDRAHLRIGHLRRDLFAPVKFCGCGARADIIVYNPIADVFLCNRCYAAYDSALAATDRARERVLSELASVPDGTPSDEYPDVPAGDGEPGRSALAVA